MADQHAAVLHRMYLATRDFGHFLPEYHMCAFKNVPALCAKVLIPYVPGRTDNPIGRLIGIDGVNINLLRKATGLDWHVDSNWFRFHGAYRQAGWIPKKGEQKHAVGNHTILTITVKGQQEADGERLVDGVRLFQTLMQSEGNFMTLMAQRGQYPDVPMQRARVYKVGAPGMLQVVHPVPCRHSLNPASTAEAELTKEIGIQADLEKDIEAFTDPADHAILQAEHQ